MKKTILLIAMAMAGSLGFAQNDSGFGLKGGLNYNGNGNFFDAARNIYESPTKNVGYHLGIFGKFGDKTYVRPELIYTSTKSTYDEGDLKLQKLDLPVLIGINIFGPLHGFAGPSFQYILDTQFHGVTINDIEKDFTVGLHAGLGVSFGNIGLDLRYERGFSENEVALINTNITSLGGDRVDARPDQVILSLSIKM